MGTSILLIFIFPAMIFEVLFSFISGAISGYPTAQVELPYDEATGLVWEYDNVDDPYINLVKTEIKDGKQVFVYENSGIRLDWNGEVMELVFTDKNGNEKIFYASGGSKRFAPQIYDAEECSLIDLTVTAKEPESGGKWKVTDHNYYIMYREETVSETQTYTVVVTPDNKKGCYTEYGMFSVEFTYVNSFGAPIELSSAIYKFEDGEHYLSEIKSQSFSDFMDGLLEHTRS